MIRYWFEFDFDNYSPIPFGAKIGCGITALSYEDALGILRNSVFNKNPIAPIKKKIEDIDISTLDAGHVLPNIGSPNIRGVWFPLGYN